MDGEDIVSTLEVTSTALGLFTDTAGFTGAITKLSAISGPLLMVTAQIMTMFFGTQESPELKQIKNVYNRMNARFDQMSVKLDGVNREIVWSRTHIPFGEIERGIRSNIRALNKIYDSQITSVRSHYKAEFLQRYHRSYTDAGGKLYDAMVNSNHVFESNIPLAVMKFTKNHRPKLQTFMVGIIKLLYDCYKLEMAYLQLSNKSVAVRKDKINTWKRKMSAVYTEVWAYDRQVKNKWESQSEEDFDTLPAVKVRSGNSDLRNQVRDFLVAKYPWRRWFILVYDDEDDYDVRYYGFHRLVHGRYVIVASKSKAAKRMNYENAKYAVSRMTDTYRERNFWGTLTSEYYREAKKAFDRNLGLFNSVPNYAMRGVVSRYCGLWYFANRNAISKRKYYWFILFG